MRVHSSFLGERKRQCALAVGTLAIAIVLAGGVPGVAPVPSLASLGSSVVVPAGLSVNWTAPVTNLSPTFWGTDVRPYATVNASLADAWNATPLGYVVWPGGKVAEGYNYTSGVITNSGGGTYQAPETTSNFVHWCERVRCHSIFQVPAEIDQPKVAAYYVVYTERTLGYHPDYWEIGNEPAGWQQFGVPWAKWGGTGGTGITAQGYAQLVHTFIAAIRAVDANARFVGLPGTGIGASHETTWLSDTVALNGPNLSAVAIHVYPAGSGSGTPTPAGFFGSLTGKGSLAQRVPADEQAIRTACPSCGPIALFVTESGAGISGGIWDTYMATYPNVPYMAAQAIQAISLGVTNLDLFSFEGSYPGSLFTGAGSPLPVYVLYSEFFSRLGPTAVPTALSTTLGQTYAQLTVNPSAGTLGLLIVNANVSAALTVSLSGASLSSRGGPASLFAWNDTAPGPSRWTSSSGIPTMVTVPPASLLLVNAPYQPTGPAPARYHVEFTETGLAAGAGWSVDLAGTELTGTNSTLATDLANGSYPFTVSPPPGWTAAPASGTLSVAGASVGQPIVFAGAPGASNNYSISFQPKGLPSASTWAVTLGNSTNRGNGTLSFFEPNGTYPYSISPPNGTKAIPSNGSITVAGATQELLINISATSRSPPVYQTSFVPSGLGAGEDWQVAFGSGTLSGPGVLDFWVPNGTYVFRVTAPASFRAQPASGSVAVAGADRTVAVALSLVPPSGGPPPPYNVSFVALGLPPLTPWSVSLGSSLVQSYSGSAISFALSNGSYPYAVFNASGYTPSVPTGVVVVNGGGWTLNVSYVPDATSSPAPGGGAPSLSLSQLFAPVVRSWLVLSLLALVAVLAVVLVERQLLRLRSR